MGRTIYRTARMGEEIKKIISSMLINEVRDPRLSGKIIGITGVEVSRDGSYAKCYVTVMDPDHVDGTLDETDEDEKSKVREDLIKGLDSAAWMFRREIGKEMHIRRVPELVFKLDTSMEYGHHIDSVIKSLHINSQTSEDGNEDR
jgi:ribosome-binding factor A